MIVGAGTVALDTVETPEGSVHEAPGGSALYFAAAAARLRPVAIVGVTGEDFPTAPLDGLAERGVDVSGVLRLPYPTFRWHARYDGSGNRDVVSVHRGGIVSMAPVVPPRFRDPEILFLGSTDPVMQGRVLEQAGAPGLVVLDTMPHWILSRRAELVALLARVRILLLNEDEARLLGGADGEPAAAERIRILGPAWVVVKRGSRGACAYGADGRIEVDAVPVARVVDPTGAGDAFAGGLVVSLAGAGPRRSIVTPEALRTASEMGALAVSTFSFHGLLGGDDG
jgi:sugar/nucleoside kinase (ribokinase family)